MTALPDLSAVDLVAAYARGELSPVAVTQAVLDRMAALEPKLHATYLIERDAALSAACASQERWRRGTPLGPIDGVPITIKENIATQGTPVRLGTAASLIEAAPADGPPAARVRESGAVILCKTTMPDFGMLSSGVSSFHALARNPWDPTKTPGGSSAGAAAAAAAGYGPLHLGTDIGGSIRLPAGWCGIIGLKPSFGRVPIDPPFLGRVAGPMTRTVADTALLMEVITGRDWRDHMSLPPADIRWKQLDIDTKGLKIGLCMHAGVGLPVEAEVRSAVEEAARSFADAGAVVEPIEPFLTPPMLDGLDRFWRARSWSEISKLPPDRQAKILPYIMAWAETARTLTGMEVYEGFGQIGAMQRAALTASKAYDFMLSPTAPIPAFAAELPSPTDDPLRPFEHIGFTVAFNMSEQPALSINCGYTRGGLPIGLQVIGQRFDDLGVLRLAKAYEALRPAQRRWPLP